MEKKFSKKEAIKFGWLQMKTNLTFFLPLFIFIFVLSFGLDRIISEFKDGSLILYVILNIVSVAIKLIISIGMIKIALSFANNAKGNFSDLFSQYKLFFHYLFATFFYNLIIIIGFCLLIIPGIIWGIKYQFYPYFIVDKDLGSIESLKKSAEITEKTKWDLFLFRIILFLINLAGLSCLGIGLLFTMPITLLAQTFVYKKLLSYNENSVLNQGETTENPLR